MRVKPMSWVNRTIVVATLAAASAVLPAQSALAGVVVSSSGPSASQFPIGRKIADSERITLRAGDTLTVLDSNGTRVLRGAGTYELGQQSARAGNRAFASLTAQRSASRARTGAVRNANAEVRKPNLWFVDVTQSGKVCLANAEQIRLWRAETAEEGRFAISQSGDNAASGTITFLQNEMLSGWAEGSVPQAGTQYLIAPLQGGEAARVEFSFVGETPDNPESLAEMLIEQGCMNQLEELSSAMMLNAS